MIFVPCEKAKDNKTKHSDKQTNPKRQDILFCFVLQHLEWQTTEVRMRTSGKVLSFSLFIANLTEKSKENPTQ